MSNGLFIGDKDPVEIRVGSRKATSVYYSGDNVPQNPVLHISAKGLTTAGIAQSGGVVDLSGNGNNGTAYGGVEVVNDSEMGECFSFDGVDDYLQLKNNALLNLTEVSLNFKIKFTVNNTARQYILLYGNFNQIILQTVNSNQNKLAFSCRGKENDTLVTINFSYELNTVYHLSFNINFVTGHIRVYIKGEFLGEAYNITTNSKINYTPQFRIGREHSRMLGGNWFFKGLISKVKIFPYALTSEQVQALYRGIKKVWSNVPDGAILHLNAKGLTTAGIAQSGGVVDLSGNGNNGTAYGGVEVVNDSEMGECFSFDGNTRISTYYIKITEALDFSTGVFSIAFKIKLNSLTSVPCFIETRPPNTNNNNFFIGLSKNETGYQNKIRIISRINASVYDSYFSQTSLTSNKEYHCVFVFDSANQKIKMYIDGNLDSTYNFTRSNLVIAQDTRIGGFNDNNASRNMDGLISDIFIYPRALTAHEVKKLYLASRR